MSPSPVIILDHLEGISIDPANAPFANYGALRSSCEGLTMLAHTVRDAERNLIASDPHAESVVLHAFPRVPSIISCAFDWFSVTLVNYLKLVALIHLMNIRGWKSSSLNDRKKQDEIRKHCSSYAKRVAPEVSVWRDKVAAHFAATDPRSDNLGTVMQSVMSEVEFKYPYYYVGLLKFTSRTEKSALQTWALTKVYDDLRPRLWPEVQLRPSRE
jgi:hypothetical protein